MDVVAADRAVLEHAIQAASGRIGQRLDGGAELRLDAGLGLCRHARAVLQGLEASAARNFERLDSSRDPRLTRVALTGLRRTLHLMRVLDHALDLIEAPEPQLGLGTLYFLNDLASALVGVEVDLIEAPLDGPLFQTLSWPYNPIFDVGTGTTPMPIVLHYPSREAASTLLLPLLVHELGHPVNAVHGVVESIQESLEGDPRWADTRAGLEMAVSVDGLTPSINTIRVYLSSLLEECFCDALATACLGPSYLLAFAAWAGLDSADEWPDQYPPTLLRLQFIIHQLREDGWDLELVQAIVAWVEDLAAVLTRSTQPHVHRQSALELAAPYVRQAANDHLTGSWARLTPDFYNGQTAAGLEDCFSQGILPAQLDHRGTAADRRSILLAAWRTEVTLRGADVVSLSKTIHAPLVTSSPDESDDLPSLSSFTDKALEMSALLDRWAASA